MVKHLFFSFLLAVATALPSLAQTGSWKSYLSYYEVEEAAEASNNIVFVLASGGLYSYNTNDHSIQTFSKTDVLNDCGIAHIAWCQSAQRLVIVYDNYNIDLLSLYGDEVVNLVDYKEKSMTVDKTVNGIDIVDQYAYLCTNFGMVKVNVADGEIANTYQIGLKVQHCYEADGYLYAMCREGLRRAPLSSNMLDPDNWKWVSDYVPYDRSIDEDLLAELQSLAPGGPKYNNFWSMRYKDGKLYTAGGGWGRGTEMHNPGAVQVLSDDDWQIYQDEGISDQTGITYEDVNAVDVDPRDANHVMAGSKGGIYEFRNGNFVKLHNSENSIIESYNGSSMVYQIISSVCYDDDGNLWALNSQAPNRSLIEYTSSGTWQAHDLSGSITLSGSNAGSLECLTFDSRDLLWFVNNHWTTPALYCYQPSTGGVQSYTSFVNQDGTTVSVIYVRYVAEDQNNNIWVATDAGPLLLSPSDIASGSTTFTQVKVPRNDGTNLADYLLSGVDISCIVVDNANRKWMGTYGNGVYCIGADNTTQVYHFTTDNSKLISDNIQSMAINSSTGEVYIGTDQGLCSYMSNANTAGAGMTKDNVYAYPNPVRPGYMGAITITGLDEDADVKIVSSNGALIEEGRASGGEYKWYGLDKYSRRVASGVYMVEIATADGEKGVVCKIAVVN